MKINKGLIINDKLLQCFEQVNLHSSLWYWFVVVFWVGCCYSIYFDKQTLNLICFSLLLENMPNFSLTVEWIVLSCIALPLFELGFLYRVCWMVNSNILFRVMSFPISKSIKERHCRLVAQLFEYQACVCEVVGSNPGQTNTQSLYINEEKVQSL